MNTQLESGLVQHLWELARERGIDATVTTDRHGDPFVIFESWKAVETMADLVYATVSAAEIEAYAPTWEHLPAERRPDPSHHIEWAIGDFGFADQFSTCDVCGVAIDVESPQPDHWYSDAYGYVCGDCLRSNEDTASDYLSGLAQQLESGGAGYMVHGIDPEDYNFVCLNRGDCYVSTEQTSDDYHPNFPRGLYGLTYAGYEDYRRLGKAARLTDPNLQIVIQYSGGASIYYARFDPNFDEFPGLNIGHWGLVELDQVDEYQAVLGYAVSRALAKYRALNK